MYRLPSSLRKQKELSLKEVRNIVLVATGSQLPLSAMHFVQIGGADLEDDGYLPSDNYLCVILD